MTGPYDDIINLPHPTSPKHPRMPRTTRAAQFAPFAALTGYNEAIRETSRLTDEQLDLDDTMKASLNEKLLLIKERLLAKPKISITFFVPDTKKAGGAYKTTTGYIKKLQEYERQLIMSDDTVISIDTIIEIQGKLFDSQNHSL